MIIIGYKNFFFKSNLRFFSTLNIYIKKQLLIDSSYVNTYKPLKIVSLKKFVKGLCLKKSTLKKPLGFLANKGLGITIKMRSNNIFSTLWSLRTGKTLYINSSGLNKISFSKKKLFYVVKKNLELFLKNIKKNIKQATLLFYSINASTKIRKFILYKLPTKRIMPIINVEYSKAFNGCKSRKCRRKKRLGFRSFK